MMDRGLTRDLLRFTHTGLELAFEGCPPGDAFRAFPGTEVNSVAALYAHAVLVEDHFVAGHSGESPLCVNPDWLASFDFEPRTHMTPEWTAALRYDPGAFQAYAATVFARTDSFLAGLSDEAVVRPAKVYDLARGPGGQAEWTETRKPLIYVFMDNVITHTAGHTGEIQAITGLMERLGD